MVVRIPTDGTGTAISNNPAFILNRKEDLALNGYSAIIVQRIGISVVSVAIFYDDVGSGADGQPAAGVHINGVIYPADAFQAVCQRKIPQLRRDAGRHLKAVVR